MEEVLVPLAFFGMVFGVCYLHYSSRNKERLALIEKGADASIFDNTHKGSARKFIILNIALLAIGIGLGVVFGGILTHSFHLDEDIAMPGSIFLMAGIGLLTSFFLTKKMENEI